MSGKIHNPLDCLKDRLPYVLAEALGIDISVVELFFKEGRVRVSRTPDPSLGDYGYSLHSVLARSNIPMERWSEIGERIIELIRERRVLEECSLVKVAFHNGYLNVAIDYSVLLMNLMEVVVNGSYKVDVGNGRLVVVEHTSANPVHPLHIGSGRNSVLGDTFARLLEYLGFRVSRRFYVNDMGRQVATLVYGYSILLENGIKPSDKMKVDHWFGVIYALTNVMIEKKRLLAELSEIIDKLHSEIEAVYNDLKSNVNVYQEISTLQTIIDLYKVVSINKYVHNAVRFVEDTYRLLESAIFSVENTYVKSRLESLKNTFIDVKRKVDELVNELNGLSVIENKLCLIDREACRALTSGIRDHVEAEEFIRRVMLKLESGDEGALQLVRRVANMVIHGFKETLTRLGVVIDWFDWESDIHAKYTRHILNEIRGLEFAETIGGALIVDLDEASREHKFVKELFAPDVAGKVTLTRSDGTSLYVTRDIGYSIFKLKDIGAWRSYNVIAVEQEREQKQLKAILYLLGYGDRVNDIIHFSYEMVNLRGYSMSGRKGEYYTIDELIDDYKKYVVKNYIDNQLKLGRKKFSYSLEEYDSILEKLAVACTRSLLLSVEPGKVLVFDPSKPGEYDLGTWIIYTLVRLQSILRKAFNVEPLDQTNVLVDELSRIKSSLDPSKVTLSNEEKEIIEYISSFNEVLFNAYNSIKPNVILEYTNKLCQVLNRFYEKYPVLGEPDRNTMFVRLALVILSFILLKDLAWILGFPIVKKL